jgi:hypothetical protein
MGILSQFNGDRKYLSNFVLNLFTYLRNPTIEAISEMQITFKDKARADEKAEHTRQYVSTLRRPATQ